MKAKRAFSFVLSLALAFVFAFGTIPFSSAEGMMQLIIAGETYNSIYLDNGLLDVVGWNYDVSEDTLSLKNFGSASKPQSRIFAYPLSGTLNVKLIGNSYLHVDNGIAFNVIGNVNFIGDGSLTIVSPDAYCVFTSYKVQVLESASLILNGAAGVSGKNGIVIDTAGAVSANVDEKAINTQGDIRIEGGTVNLNARIGLFTYDGKILASGGSTSVNIVTTMIAASTTNGYIEFSANKTIRVGNASPSTLATVYNGEKCLKVTFAGQPKLNPPRDIHWDETVLPDDARNPVGRWSEVENAASYTVRLYFNATNQMRAEITGLTRTNCFFGDQFTDYGQYYFTVTACAADGSEWLTSDESARSTDTYYFLSEGTAARYYVTLPESEDFTIVPHSGTTVVNYNEPFSFDVVLDDAYTNSEIKVWGNAARIVMRNGFYRIDHVTENVVLRVDGLVKNTYTVSIPENEAYTVHLLLDNYTEVEYGGSCSFSLELSSIYSQSQLVVKANGEVIVPRYGIIYDVKNINGDVNITVEGLVRQSYIMTYRQLDGTLISTDSTVHHGYAATQPANPTLANGLSFEGWYLDGERYDFSTPVTSDLTIYARYTAPVAPDGYYQISTADQLRWFRDEVNYGNGTINGRLMQNIELNQGKYTSVGYVPEFAEDAENWIPIGCYDYNDNTIENVEKFYHGSFDGNSKTISGVFCTRDAMDGTASQLGLFGITSADASIANLNLEMTVVDGYAEVGGIVGRNGGAVSGCASSALVGGIISTGGIAGTNSGSVSSCNASGTVDSRLILSSSYTYGNGVNAGGVVGSGDGSISSCSFNGTVHAADNAGGILGSGNASVTGCTANGEVEAASSSIGTNKFGNGLNCGGIVGSGNAVILNCTNSAALTSEINCGGILGSGNAEITDCANTAMVSSVSYAGGVLGAATEITLEKCSNTGSVTAINYAGGLIGSGGGTAYHCYSYADIAATNYAGGFVGEAVNLAITNSHSYGEVSASFSRDAVVGSCTGAFTATESYYCSEISGVGSSYGQTQNYDIFFNGYLAYILNYANGDSFWAQGEFCPVFVDTEHLAKTALLNGSGTQQAPYLITNEKDLRMMSLLINGEASESYLDSYYLQTGNIAFHNPTTVNNFNPMCSPSLPFTGEYNGGGFTVSGLNIAISGSAGMFVCTSSAKISNLTVASSTVSGGISVGAVVGSFSGNIESCSSIGCTVSGTRNIGGVVGNLFGNAIGCTSSSNVISSGNYAGGVVGKANGTLSACSSSSEISGAIIVGGVVGYVSGTIIGCTSTGSVIGNGNVGGIAGQNDATLSKCSNSASVTGSATSANIGGIAGYSAYPMTACFNSGAVSGKSAVGGIVGENYSSVNNCYSCGTVSGDDMCGTICGTNSLGTIGTCAYAFAPISSGSITTDGTVFTATERANGIAAYYLNDNGVKRLWAQGTSEPSVAAAESEAVIYLVNFYVDSQFYYRAATRHEGTVEAPTNPQKQNFNFLRWNRNFTSVTSDINTYAIFDQSNWIVLKPESQYEISPSTRILTGVDIDDAVTAEEILAQVANENVILTDYSGTEVPLTDVIMSGYKIVLTSGGIIYDEVLIVIAGDVTEDGVIDSLDAFYIEMLVDGLIFPDELQLSAYYAADLDGDLTITANDARLFEDYLLGKSTG